MKVYHIYYNTSGNSGLYLNPIYEALKSEYKQKFFVNYYYPLDIAEFRKVFFPLTEKSEFNGHKTLLKRTLLRKIIRFLELKSGNRVMIRHIKRERPDIVNYSLTNMPDSYAVLKKIRKRSPSSKIVVTCHDVSAFQETNHIPYRKIYRMADYLLVHNANSIDILRKDYGIAGEKIKYHPFPLIDLSVLQKGKHTGSGGSIPTFLFIGVMREEKGVQYLVDAWKELGENFNGRLMIAGFKPDNVEIDFTAIETFQNVKLRIRMLSDQEYFDMVSASDYVVFPYTKVGNSGVLSTAVSLGKVPVATKLPTFMESDYVLDELTCEAKSAEALKLLIERISSSYPDSYQRQQAYVEETLQKNKVAFSDSVRCVYHQMLTQ